MVELVVKDKDSDGGGSGGEVVVEASGRTSTLRLHDLLLSSFLIVVEGMGDGR